MKIRVRTFGPLREQHGEHVDLDLPDDPIVADIRRALPGQYAVAVNLEYADDTTPITPSDEIALIPPVSGGRP